MKRGHGKMLLVLPILVLASLLLYGLSGASASPHSVKVSSALMSELDGKGSVRVIVKMKDSGKSFGAASQRSIEDLPIENDKIKNRFSSFNGFSAEISSEDLENLKNDDSVEEIFYDRPVHAFLQDSAPLINATPTWARNVSGTNITGLGQTVCVIDTGVNYSHPDLGGCLGNSCKVLGGYDFVKHNAIPMDDYGHGTHVAGIIAANGGIKGIAPDAKLIAIKALDDTGSGYDSDVIAGIDWCVNNATYFNISVISMSLGADCYYQNGTWTGWCYNSSCESSMTAVINNAVSKNITVVIASGNSGNYTYISDPACVQNATSVGATDKNDAIASYSNRGLILDIMAPGSLINSTNLSSPYTVLSGTSMAAPHVAGAIALMQQSRMLELNKKYTVDEIETILKNNGESINDTATGIIYSRINVFNSIDSLIAPNYTWIAYPNVTNVSQSIIVNISANDNVGILYYNITINSISYQMNKSGDYYWHNFTPQTSGNYSYNATFGDSRNTITTTTILLEVGESIPPKYYNLSGNMTYGNYFNSTWIDENNISSVQAFLNNTDGSMNETFDAVLFNASANNGIYIINETFAVGNYTLQWFANDTFGNENQTSVLNVTISRATPVLNLTLYVDGTGYSSDIHVENNSYVNLTASTTAEGMIKLSLSNSSNFSWINQDYDLVYNYTQFNETGTFNVTAFYNETQNYSSLYQSYLIYVESNSTAPRITKVLPTSTYDADGNVTLKINATDATLKNYTFYLYNSSGAQNSSISSNLSGMINETNWIVTNLLEGNYSWQAVVCDNSSNCNYTSNYSLIIDTTVPNATLSIEYTSIVEDTSTDITCTGSNSLSGFANVSIWIEGEMVDHAHSSSVDYTFTPDTDGKYDIDCKVYDNAGNLRTDSDHIDVSASDSGGSSGSSSTTTTTTTASTVYTFTY
ncbi:MAG: S8 family serine peptidase, partial [Nanoarchaeota archaeon]|nr:S8 family serine peptidase [Nanoarchaeota archaeon]